MFCGARRLYGLESRACVFGGPDRVMMAFEKFEPIRGGNMLRLPRAVAVIAALAALPLPALAQSADNARARLEPV